MVRGDFYDRYFPPSRPRAAKGGIRAQSKRGKFAETWWAKRWTAVLESFQIGGRLSRGRSYARRGQVLSIEVEKGRISARVQGSRPKPYDVEINVKPLGPAAWKKVAAAVAGQAVFASKLLSGEMPREMEDAFRAHDVSLFPERLNDLTTDCSCPDWSNPCKHVAAVYYLLGEEFDRDPFLIFRMRGMNRDEFMTLLGQNKVARRTEPAALPPEPLVADPRTFYAVGALPQDVAEYAPAISAGAGVTRRLGKFPFWRGAVPLIDFLDAAYAAAAARATDTLERM